MFSLLQLWSGVLVRLFRSRGILLIENLALRQQLAVFKRQHSRSAQGRTPEREESAVSGRMDWSKVFLADGRRFVLVTDEKDGRKRPTICSSP